MKLIYLIILLPCFSIAQEDISIKYGEPTEFELKLTEYEKDTTADAVVLYEKGENDD